MDICHEAETVEPIRRQTDPSLPENQEVGKCQIALFVFCASIVPCKNFFKHSN